MSKEYKCTMNRYINKYKHNREYELRNMQSKNPKQYWKFLNSIKEKSNTRCPPLDDFYEYFEKLNQNVDAHFDISDAIDELDFQDDEDLLNAKITEAEITACINSINNGKSPGDDRILNEHIKTTKHLFMPLYVCLFNCILDSGILPDSWLMGKIFPIFKNKGDPSLPENYRPITILSCLGKLFTSVLNARLTRFLDEFEILSETQTGFRKDYSTLDNIFTLHSLIELLRVQKKKLFCCFIDFSRAFDTVWRVGLWRKLLVNNINGKILRVIKNMYDNIKSCVSINNQTSGYFSCNIGVRQGENLSPLLFSLYLNDLETYFLTCRHNGVTVESNSQQIYIFTKIFLLLYADDTVIVSEDPDDFQACLNSFLDYCDAWKLQINFSKTKIIIFGARNITNFRFHMGTTEIEIIKLYKYLGVFFSSSGSFLNARKHIVEQARKAMYLLFMRINNLSLPLDLQLKLFDHTVLPILCYASEIFGFENLKIIENIHNEFLRKITKSRSSTPMYMLYAELGRYPIEIIIKSRAIAFWNRLITGKQTKLSCILYHTLYSHEKSFKWIEFIKGIFSEIGRNDIWIYQNNIISRSINKYVKSILIEQNLQHWHDSLQNSQKGRNYSIIKQDIVFEKYLITIPRSYWLSLFKFRTDNHKFPVETGRWHAIEYAERKCNLCNLNDVGDNYHYLLICPYFTTDRKLYIHKKYYSRPNIIKYRELMAISDKDTLEKL
ncbi:MAG: reverse transcriptase family protein, partial [Candidatus Thiodiazotropha sp.]